MFQYISQHPLVLLPISIGIISEALSLLQQVQYPTNSGFGGVLSGILKVLQTINASINPQPPSSASQ